MPRRTPDDFESPLPHAAPAKSVVDKVLSGVIAAGNGAVSLVAGLLASVLVLYSSYVIYDNLTTQQRALSSSWDLLQYKPEFLDDHEVPLSASSIAEINKDYRAWLTVYDTNIDYPVMQGENDTHYASYDIYNKPSLTGAIYMAAANAPDFSDSYNLIYGHHMDNHAMFGGLDLFMDEAYFNSHKTAILVTGNRVYDIEFFAMAETDAYESHIYTVGNHKDDVVAFLRSGGAGGSGIPTTVKFFDNAIAQNAEKVIALSTCRDATTNGRLVLFGRMTARRYRLTVHYVFSDGVPRLDDFTETYLFGDPYSVANPYVEGFFTDEPAPEGTLTEDTEVTIHYYAIPTPTPTVAPTNTPVPTDTPEPVIVPTPVPQVRLTIHYVDENGQPLFGDWQQSYNVGAPYYVVSPTQAGYTADLEIVEGTITADTEITVHYVRKQYTLTVRYVTIDGTEVAPTVTERHYTGESYNVGVPTVEGYTSSRTQVRGTMGSSDEVITVLYVPAARPDQDPEEAPVRMFSIDDYETPLGMDHINIQIGICLE